jgi:predicted ATPase
MGERRWN